MKNKIFRILPAFATIAIMVMIFMFSAQNSNDSSEVSGGLIKHILDLLPFSAHLQDAQKALLVKQWHNIVRKYAHFTIYAALGLCACAMFMANVRGRKKIFWWTAAAALCGVYAASDELHQMFIPGRSGELRDILIDTCGGGTGAVIMLLVRRAYSALKARKEKKND